MNQANLLTILYKSQYRMEVALMDNDFSHYPPLYTSDYVTGKLQATREVINMITAEVNNGS